MFTSILLFLKPFKTIIFKGIALVLFFISLYAAWHAFTGHYKDIGRTEIQIKWDKEKSEIKAIVDKQKSDIAAATKAA